MQTLPCERVLLNFLGANFTHYLLSLCTIKGASVQIHWLKATPPANKKQIYIHFPICYATSANANHSTRETFMVRASHSLFGQINKSPDDFGHSWRIMRLLLFVDFL